MRAQRCFSEGKIFSPLPAIRYKTSFTDGAMGAIRLFM